MILWRKGIADPVSWSWLIKNNFYSGPTEPMPNMQIKWSLLINAGCVYMGGCKKWICVGLCDLMYTLVFLNKLCTIDAFQAKNGPQLTSVTLSGLCLEDRSRIVQDLATIRFTGQQKTAAMSLLRSMLKSNLAEQQSQTSCPWGKFNVCTGHYNGYEANISRPENYKVQKVNELETSIFCVCWKSCEDITFFKWNFTGVWYWKVTQVFRSSSEIENECLEVTIWPYILLYFFFISLREIFGHGMIDFDPRKERPWNWGIVVYAKHELTLCNRRSDRISDISMCQAWQNLLSPSLLPFHHIDDLTSSQGVRFQRKKPGIAVHYPLSTCSSVTS